MLRPRRFMRWLRVLVACTFVSLLSGASSPARVWSEAVVLVGESTASSRAAADTRIAEPRPAPVRATTIARTPPPCGPTADPDLVVIEDRYLRHRALLC